MHCKSLAARSFGPKVGKTTQRD
ncbi:hypothetical protein MPLA_670011 [Mesorhizobium sp. ORS 3359]|nr:hypothetical protein MPLA_670011 [Mesorhizobium sp. ORS 3359]